MVFVVFITTEKRRTQRMYYDNLKFDTTECSLPSTRWGLAFETAVVDVAGKFVGQIQVVVDNVFEMHTRSVRVCEEKPKGRLTLV